MAAQFLNDLMSIVDVLMLNEPPVRLPVPPLEDSLGGDAARQTVQPATFARDHDNERSSRLASAVDFTDG